jgi:flagellar biosynthesis protein
MAAEPLNKAVALGYAAGMPAPRVLAQGRGAIAQAIVDKAQELGLPSRTEPALVEFLMELDLHTWIPPELYAAVAEVMAWAYEESQRELPVAKADADTERVLDEVPGQVRPAGS